MSHGSLPSKTELQKGNLILTIKSCLNSHQISYMPILLNYICKNNYSYGENIFILLADPIKLKQHFNGDGEVDPCNDRKIIGSK